ncbi:hypothetical protein A2X44_04385 [candidate division CPR3 bacterium GWF2_35_18]|uniref:Phage shock protein C, PspC n=1 Tax=candidate division CPR3 bacterium GW2011_GWF2_35_18 TaxID=1618350 RepID=A0A0G0EPW7_UNCC3|nr:MAG: hypothetical protein UR67_C0007G0067 [candidate division CPR3 bacterium GW2011_GWF2_35_18]KKP87011.1 MAG: hypothetical protein UR87_C0006G0004 [candidate division CPR3 bacterium GW2011_GWE2_35_7]OGB62592.1 MAG: hypothetical protein A2X44_04385 [candidate division CPR3 bacterium GWF2_35_18]OGB65843.1 MAG: hypothetical protein A2250_01635 [candidate division CPR3 bacterium RIFOXYA2_FULL_35_13]OGB77230.1 MAG: hypothetical protein A2476_01565 [candidate division CPR3 bacterium RIFOXYC2_FULL
MKENTKESQENVNNNKETVSSKRLCRSEKDKMIGGVCGGIAEYFNIDSSIVRLIFALIVLAGGAGVLVYIILWVILPSETASNSDVEKIIEKNVEEIAGEAEKFAKNVEKSAKKDESRIWWGIIVIVIGLLFLFDNFGFFRVLHINVWHLWPLGLIILGFLILGRRN